MPGKHSASRRDPHSHGAVRAPRLLWLAAAVTALLMLTPALYLVIRCVEAGPRALDLLLRPRTLTVFLNSAWLAAAVTSSAVALGVVLAWLTTRSDLPGRSIWTIVLALPLVLPSYVAAYTLIGALGPRGLLQSWLAPLGVDRLPSIYGFPGAWLALTLVSYPYVLLSVRAGLRGLDPAMEDAARTLGAGPGRVFRQITLPHLRPAIAAGALLVALYALSDFGAVSLLQYDSFTRAIYLQYTASLDRSAAAVLALLLVALTGSILTLEARVSGRAHLHRIGAGAARRPRRARLGIWRGPAVALCALVALLALGVPVAVMGLWLGHGWRAGEPLVRIGPYVWNSVLVSGVAAAVTVVVALPVVGLAVRHPDWRTRLMERCAYVGHALPGLVIALALVFLGARYLPFLYQTLALLIFAYVIRFLPQAVGAVRASLLKVSPRLEDAARNLGRTPRRVMLSITLPLLRPGLWSGAALVFLTTMKELPATLLLGPTGFHTLATRIWTYTEDAFYARAAGPALVLVLVSAVGIWIILSQDEEELYG
jgi:iron(III) transport system permease protein